MCVEATVSALTILLLFAFKMCVITCAVGTDGLLGFAHVCGMSKLLTFVTPDRLQKGRLQWVYNAVRSPAV